MQDILNQARAWINSGDSVALATVVETWGSSPRAAGAHMAVRADGGMAGSVSGGCVEGAVVQEALAVLAGGPPRLLHYGVTDESAWDVGLACGGSIEIFVHPLEPVLLDPIAKGYAARRTQLLAIIIAGPETSLGQAAVFASEGHVAGTWTLGGDEEIEALIAQTLEGGDPQRATVDLSGEKTEIFMDILQPAPTLIMIGGVHISIALAEIARPLGYRTVVIDPRKSFATEARFPSVDQLIQCWPEEGLAEAGIDTRTAVAVLTHDPKIDDPALLTALHSPAFYIGSLGSRKTHAKRIERLCAQGIKSDELARLNAPIGLDLGARTPEEIALSILAEITATRYGKLSTRA
jgi:xanthine dehydrogenase accessory factor